MSKELLSMGIAALLSALGKGGLSSAELTAACLASIKENEPRLGAFLTLDAERTLEKAAEIDTRRMRGERLLPLAGLPMALADNIMAKGLPTTCASQMLGDFISPYDATVVDRLADCILLGKTNIDEFGLRSTATSPTQGAAAAVAAGEALFALGSDADGLTRQSAALCGAVFMKPTYGAVSRYGLVALASSLEQIGPITRNVRDNALLLSAIAGLDRRDATSKAPQWGELSPQIGQGITGMRIALSTDCYQEGLAPAAHAFKELGATVEEIKLPDLSCALAAHDVILSAEAFSGLARFNGIRCRHRAGAASLAELYEKHRAERFGDGVKHRILLGGLVLSQQYRETYYERAQALRTALTRTLLEQLGRYDAILMPLTPRAACHGRYRRELYTAPANMAGLPALSLALDKSGEGAPTGIQLIGKPFAEPTLYRIGAALEEVCR